MMSHRPDRGAMSDPEGRVKGGAAIARDAAGALDAVRRGAMLGDRVGGGGSGAMS